MNLLFDNFETFIEAPNGIKRLREMILQLAVQGKLVPQDPNDKLADGFLEEINKKQLELITYCSETKRIRLDNDITLNECPFTLPNSWSWVYLGRLMKKMGAGSTPLGGRKVYQENGVIFLRSQNVWNSGLKLDDVARISLEIHNKMKNTHILNGDILLNITGASIGRSSVVPENFECANVSQHVAILRPIDKRLNQFLHLCIISPFFQKTIMDRQVGMSREGLSMVKLMTFPIPIPPLAEQNRIVVKVEKLMTLCDKLEKELLEETKKRMTLNKASLHALNNSKSNQEFNYKLNHIKKNFDLLYSTPENVSELKQTILQLAVQGKLVPQDPNDLPAPCEGKWFVYVLQCEDGSYYKGFTKDILQRWKEHARGKGSEWTKKNPPIKLVHWEEFDSEEKAVKREKDLKTGFVRKWLEREIKAGRTRQAGEPATVLLQKIKKEKEQLIKDGKIKKQKPLLPITDDEKPFNLPYGWVWSNLSTLGLINPRNDFDDDKKTSFVPMPLIFAEYGKQVQKEVKVWGDIKKGFTHFAENDVVLAKITPCFENKKSAVMKNLTNGIGAGTTELHVFRPVEKLLLSEYVLIFFKSPNFVETGKTKMTGSAGQKRVSKEYFSYSPFPLPPLAEQKRIVAKVDKLMSLCNNLSKNLSQKENKNERLINAVVNQLLPSAFL